jgi:hypothetical protein
MAAGRSPPDWYGIGVPKKTPTEIVEKLSKEVRRLVHRFRETDDMRRIHGLRFLKMAA